MTDEIVMLDEAIPVNDLAMVWIERYRSERYLSHIDESALIQRLDDIVQNLLIFDETKQKYVPNFHISSDEIYRPVRNLDWLQMATDAREEFLLRGVQIPQLTSLKPLINFERSLSKQAWARRKDLEEASIPSLKEYEIPTCLFRYTKEKYNKELIYDGRIRISPASAYSDHMLAKAQHASETEVDTHNPHFVFTTDDYYTICLSSVYRYRMYYEFRADSCIAIYDLRKFQDLINNSISRYNKTSTRVKLAKAIYCPIYYYDPIFTLDPTTVEEIFFMKPFRYAYQHEYRIVILPTRPQVLDAFFLELGSLEDIAELVCET